MKSAATVLGLTAFLLACGSQEKSSTKAFGTKIPEGKKPLQVSTAYNPVRMQNRFELLSLAAGLDRTLLVTLYSGMNMQGEHVEFLAYDGLKSGDIVLDGDVLVLDTPTGGIADIISKNSLEAPMTSFYQGLFSFHSKNGQGMAVGEWQKAEGQSYSVPYLLDLCSDHYYDRLENHGKMGPESLQLACDIDVEDQDLQIRYNKTTENPEGTTFTFRPNVLLNRP